MLALLLLAQHVIGKEVSKDTYIISQIRSCPDLGYFFKRDLNPNSIEPSCYLCFCQGIGTAVCWPRETRRCDEKNYYHTGKKKRDIRPRRSAAFSDIFFRDAARDVFNKRLPEECKPFEASYSEGCPPADWCIGCTVCDCDANGRWDCHILSFCPENKQKKHIKKRRGSLRYKKVKRQLSTKKTTTNTTKKPPTKVPKKIINNQVKGINSKIQSKTKQVNSKQHKQYKGKSKITTRKPKILSFERNVTKAKINLNKKGETKAKMPINLKKSKIKHQNKNKNDSAVTFAKTIMKKVMASVEKFVNESLRHFNNTTKAKIMQKSSMPKYYNKKPKKSLNKENKVKSKILSNQKTKQWIKFSHKKNEKTIINSRRKREVGINTDLKKLNNEFILPTSTLKTKSNSDYYTYNISPITTTINQVLLTSDQTFNKTHEVNMQENRVILEKNNMMQNKNNPKTMIFKQNNKTIYFKTDNQSNWFTPDNNKIKNSNYNKNIKCGNICELRKALKKLFFGKGKRNTTRKSKFKKLNLLPRLRKILFGNSNKNKFSYDNIHKPLKRRNIIKILCKNLGSCKVNHTTKELQFKFEKLKSECNNIFRSVSIIKGLLKLLDIGENSMNSNLTIKNRQFTDDDIKKLNAIINDEYNAKYNLMNLTATQRTQIAYIKENTLTFMQSVEKIAYILNDIIKILTKGKGRQKYLLSNNYYKRLGSQQIIKTNKRNLMTKKLEKLKDLLINYNLVQNKFMKQMFHVLSTPESKGNKLTKLKVSENESDNYNSIEIYAKTILTNLRKLKDLAEKLSFKSRRKRAAMDDENAIEYLLMLMEYLLKQNKPIDVSPVNDGIDLLIEAIKSSPDIKPIKKKVLYNDVNELKEPEYESLNLRRNNNIIDDSNATLSFQDKGFKTFESIVEKEDFTLLKKSDKVENHSQEVINKNIEDLTSETKNDTQNKNHNTIIDIVNDRMEKLAKDEIKRFEVFIDDTDEDDIPFENTTNLIETAIEAFTEHKLPIRTSAPNKIEAKILNNYHDENEIMTKLDWIDENYNHEEERVKNNKVKETTTETVIEVATRTIKSKKDKYADPISSISQEFTDNDRITKKDIPETSYKNGMSLTNTLDYGIEKSFLNSNSKEDKYNESFPSYSV